MFTVQSALALPPLNGAGPRDRAIVATLLYYDLFSFPLRADELVRFAQLDGPQPLTPADLACRGAWWDSCAVNGAADSGGAGTSASGSDALWFLKGREQLIPRRAALSAASVGKLERARKFASLLQLVPGVRFIGVTGSLAMQSAVPADDIDFLIITRRNRLWLTRALVLAALLAWGVKRPDDGRSEYPDLICANIFLSEADLYLADQNLFIAHEVCQMLPLLGARTYHEFLDANAWVRSYLPQWQPPPADFQDRTAWRQLQRGFELAFAGAPGSRLDQMLGDRQLRRIQSKHARGHNPNVKLSATQLRFHPRDLSDYIVNTFNARWEALTHG